MDIVALIVDNAIPIGLFDQLRHLLRHDVEVCDAQYGIGSHAHDTFWYELSTPPKTIVDVAIQQMRAYLPDMQAVAGAEWWLLSVGASRGLPWHFDVDLERARQSKWAHPVISSVLYLTEEGGPTVVAEQRADDLGERVPQYPSRCYVFTPKLNRFSAFSGDLWHGVAAASTNQSTVRRTLLVNWWRDAPARSSRRSKHRACNAPRYESPDFTRLSLDANISKEPHEAHVTACEIVSDIELARRMTSTLTPLLELETGQLGKARV
jgi:hypothetical protein